MFNSIIPGVLPAIPKAIPSAFGGLRVPGYVIVDTNYIDPSVSFTRASTKNVFNSAGLLTSLSTNVPGFDTNPTTLQPRGLLLEGARTNSIRNSAANGGGAGVFPTNWDINTSGGLTITNIGNTVENGFTCHEIRFSGVSTGTAASIRFETTTNIVAATGQTWTSSFYVRQSGGSLTNIGSVVNIIQERDAAGAFLSSGSSNISLSTLSLERSIHTRTLSNAGTLRLTNSVGFSFGVGFAIDITLRIAIPQLELGSFASSPIITTSTAATRAADVADLLNLATLGFNAEQGTMVAEFEYAGLPPGGVVYMFNDNTDSNEIGYRRQVGAPANGFAIVRRLAVDQYAQANVGLNALVVHKHALAWSSNNIRGCLNGTLQTLTTSATIPAVNRLMLGRRSGSNTEMFGWLRRLTYYPTRLPDATLQALTV